MASDPAPKPQVYPLKASKKQNMEIGFIWNQVYPQTLLEDRSKFTGDRSTPTLYTKRKRNCEIKMEATRMIRLEWRTNLLWEVFFIYKHFLFTSITMTAIATHNSSCWLHSATCSSFVSYIICNYSNGYRLK